MFDIGTLRARTAWRRIALAGLTLAGLCAGAHAQAQPSVSLIASSAARCLAPTSADEVAPVYPADELRMKRGSSVDVSLTFDSPTSAPSVKFNGSRMAGALDDPFYDAVTTYARHLRVPCMAADSAPVTLRQVFDFVPNDGRKVAWTAAVDEGDAVRTKSLGCLLYPTGSDADIDYPMQMLRQRREATVVARVRFVAADRAPEVDVLDDGGDKSFAAPIPFYVAHMRLPCMQGGPIDTFVHFRYRIDVGPAQRRVLNDVDLRTFLASVKPIAAGSAYFDTNAMKCPFDIRLKLEQPYEPNVVEELDEDVPARHAFLDWIARQQLNLGPKPPNDLLDQPMNIHVPCATIDL